MKKIEYSPICSVEELPSGERLFLEVNGLSIVIINHEGDFYAIADECTHDEGPVGEGEIEGHQIICPRHGARFDIRTGEVLALPATRDIPSYPVRIKDGMIEIGIEG